MFMLSVVTSPIMLRVVMLNVVMLCVVAPFFIYKHSSLLCLFFSDWKKYYNTDACIQWYETFYYIIFSPCWWSFPFTNTLAYFSSSSLIWKKNLSVDYELAKHAEDPEQHEDAVVGEDGVVPLDVVLLAQRPGAGVINLFAAAIYECSIARVFVQSISDETQRN